MPMPSPTQSSRPIGLLLLAAIAVVLYFLMLANAWQQPSGGGEASMAAAFAALALTAVLWIVLAFMLVVGGIGGTMPRWAGWLAGVLVPLSGVANFVAVDMCSRNMAWAIVIPVVLPLLIAFYAFWARSPQLKTRLPGERTSVAVWSAVFFISVATFVLAA